MECNKIEGDVKLNVKCNHTLSININDLIRQGFGSKIGEWIERYGFCENCIGIIEKNSKKNKRSFIEELFCARYNFAEYGKTKQLVEF